MIEWRDDGAARAHGETAAIVAVFAAGNGRHAGVVRGGVSRKFAPILQPGAQAQVVWHAWLEEHLARSLWSRCAAARARWAIGWRRPG